MASRRTWTSLVLLAAFGCGRTTPSPVPQGGLQLACERRPDSFEGRLIPLDDEPPELPEDVYFPEARESDNCESADSDDVPERVQNQGYDPRVPEPTLRRPAEAYRTWRDLPVVESSP